MFYRLAAPMERNKKRLFDFFQDASKDEKQLRSDKKRLREAVASGACTLSEWNPFLPLLTPRHCIRERSSPQLFCPDFPYEIKLPLRNEVKVADFRPFMLQRTRNGRSAKCALFEDWVGANYRGGRDAEGDFA
jgi:hypothetical protein